MTLHLTDLRLIAADSDHQRTGLMGWLSMTVGGCLRIDGVALRRTVDGRFALSFPQRTDALGRRHSIIRPVHDDARREVEAQVIKALGCNVGEELR